MPEHTLRDRRILVVEDEYFLADELQTELRDAGAVVLGPIGTLEQALHSIRSDQQIDGAILDLSLQGEMVFPAADLLIERNVPFVFTTGYDESEIPSRFASVVRCEKPIDLTKIVHAVGRIIHR